MLCDGFRHFEQGFELTPGVFQRRGGGYFGRGDSRIRHSRQNSTRVGPRSTKGAMAKPMKSRPGMRAVTRQSRLSARMLRDQLFANATCCLQSPRIHSLSRAASISISPGSWNV
jgi:hypothetical protein